MAALDDTQEIPVYQPPRLGARLLAGEIVYLDGRATNDVAAGRSNWMPLRRERR